MAGREVIFDRMRSRQFLFSLLVFLSFILCYCQMPRVKRTGTRPKCSNYDSELMNKVYCFNCKIFILNPKKKPDEIVLNYHYGSKGCCDQSLVFKRKESIMVTFPPGAHFGMFDSPTDPLSYDGWRR